MNRSHAIRAFAASVLSLAAAAHAQQQPAFAAVVNI